MIKIRNIEVKKAGNYLVTIGLKQVIGAELNLLMYDLNINQYLKLLTYLIDYFVDDEPAINDGENHWVSLMDIKVCDDRRPYQYV